MGRVISRPCLSHVPARPALSRGFTLIELMLAVGLVAVLAGVALPAYQSHVAKVRIATAVRDITVMSLVIQGYRLDHSSHPASLSDVNLDGKTDPWGRPYIYFDVEANGHGPARKDKALNPINTDFDLYSAGPDGQTKKQVSQKDSVDDVIRGRNGGFVGIAEDF
jgi:general secretion pathway protein G